MSYDLYFKPRSGEISGEEFRSFFSDRKHYDPEKRGSFYLNHDTGVYFSFDFTNQKGDEGDPEDPSNRFPLSFNINYFRPSYFILEAEPEVTELVQRFDLTVHDPQLDGMGEGPYDKALLISGWAAGNAFAYSAMLARVRDVLTLPTDRLLEIWRWNYARADLQRTVGGAKFVPIIFGVQMETGVATVCAWADAVPSILPKVDYLFLSRRELAPKRFFVRRPDDIFVAWDDVAAMIEAHVAPGTVHGGFELSYGAPPPDVVNLVQRLTSRARPTAGAPWDQVLDHELVEKALNSLPQDEFR